MGLKDIPVGQCLMGTHIDWNVDCDWGISRNWNSMYYSMVKKFCSTILHKNSTHLFQNQIPSNMELRPVVATSSFRWRGNCAEKSCTKDDAGRGEFYSSCSWRSSSALQSCLSSWPSPPQPWCCHRICASPSNGSHTQQCDEAPETNVILVCMYLLYSDTIGIWGNSRSVTINDNSLYPITLHLYWIKRCTYAKTVLHKTQMYHYAIIIITVHQLYLLW